MTYDYIHKVQEILITNLESVKKIDLKCYDNWTQNYDRTNDVCTYNSNMNRRHRYFN